MAWAKPVRNRGRASRRVSRRAALRFLLIVALGCIFSGSNGVNARHGFFFARQQTDATADDSLQAAQKAFAEAEKLFYEGTPESRARAIPKYQEALRIHRARGNRLAQYITLVQLGSAYQLSTRWQEALDCFQQALALARTTNNRAGEINSLFCIAIIYHERSDWQRAIDFYNQTIQKCREAKNQIVEVDALNKLGLVYDEAGDALKALDLFQRALTLGQAINSRYGQAESLINIATLYDRGGQTQKALDGFHQALTIARQINDPATEAQALTHLGGIYHSFGELEIAADYYQEALPLWRKVKDPYGEAAALNSLGVLYDAMGEHDKALARFAESLALHRANGNRRMEALTLSNLARNALHAGAKPRALDLYEQALNISQTLGQTQQQGVALKGLGLVYDALGEFDKAISYYDRALARFRAAGDVEKEEDTLYCAALTQSRQGKLDDARASIEATLKLSESLRAQLSSSELRASSFAARQKAYELYIDLLMALHERRPGQGFDALALQASEQSRARSLLDSLAEAAIDIRQGVDPALIEQEQRLRLLLNAKAGNRRQLGSGRAPGQSPAIERQAADKEVARLAQQYRELQAQMRQRSPRYAALTQPQPADLTEIQGLLDADSVLLEYFLGERQSYLWAVTPDSVKSYALPPRREIEDQARRLYELLTVRQLKTAPSVMEQAAEPVVRQAPKQVMSPVEADTSYWVEAARLSALILRPVAAELDAKRIILVTHGALQYLPFAALPLPGTHPRGGPVPLILAHEIVNLPSASVLSALRREAKARRPAPEQVAVFADPVFETNDPRIRVAAPNRKASAPRPLPPRRLTSRPAGDGQRARQSDNPSAPLRLARLPFTRQEAETILAVAATGANFVALDFRASRESVTGAGLDQYRIVHFATHGILDTRHPELSGLVLSLFDENGQPRDGFLRLHEIYNLKLSADVVTLSACQSGLGKEIRGEGLVGLTRGFMYAGALRVVASLWQVDDLSTAELMSRFYRNMLQKGMRATAALRAAQIEMLSATRWRSPYFWAPFVLQGEWR